MAWIADHSPISRSLAMFAHDWAFASAGLGCAAGIPGLLESFHVSDWLHDLGEIAVSREVLQAAILQLGLIAGIFALAWAIRLASCGVTDRLAARVAPYIRAGGLGIYVRGLVTLAYAWLLLVIVRRSGAHHGFDLPLLGIAASLTALWIVLRLSTLLFRDALLARLVAMVAWIIAALDITGLLTPASAVLDSAALTIGAMRLSLLMVVKAVLLVAVLLWAALGLARLLGTQLQHLGLSPSIQALSRNMATIVLVTLALLIGLSTVGIDLTALTVFSGAVGVGLGFGLQKIVSNFVSGIILLLERSIRPGDVIEVGHTYGLVMSVGARYAAVRGRDGKEFLIPNETLITNQVTNWSLGNPLLRLDLTFPAPLDADIRKVRQFAIEAAQQTKRVVASPPPVCHITDFGDNAIHLLLRFWIEDPANGIKNITGDVYLALWDAMRAHGVSLPNPAREVLVREVPPALARAVPVRNAAE